MARINTEELDPIRYKRIKKEQQELKERYLYGVTMARLCPYCHNKVEVLCKGHHSASYHKCSQCGEQVLFPPVEFRTAK